MGKLYYPSNPSYPPLIRAIDSRIALYICEILYGDEEIEDALKRYVLSDIGAGNPIMLKDKGEIDGLINMSLPFTSYNFNENELLNDRRNSTAARAWFYSEQVDSFVKTKPREIEIPMVSFFNEYPDYLRAREILTDVNGLLTRLWVPLIANEHEINVPIDIEFEISKGEYNTAFETWLEKGKINDIVHNMKVKYFDLMLETGGVYPVDDVELALYQLSNIDISLSTQIGSNIPLLDTPTVESTIPTNESTGIDPDYTATTIQVTFNVGMDSDSVESNFSIVPFKEGEFSWDDDNLILTYTFFDNLDSTTEYIITIGKESTNINNEQMEEDYIFSFTTV